MERKTALYEAHGTLGGRLTPFAGYLLPVQYGAGVIAEHMAVRTACGLFDVSHMGEILCQGEGALAYLNYVLTNDFTGMYDGQARYSPMCNEAGGVVDDLIVYRVREDCYFIVVNASNKDKDFLWMKKHQFPNVELTDISEAVAQIALQGPNSRAVLQKRTGGAVIPETYYSFVPRARVAGVECLLSRTGYTGEDGYELYMAASDAPAVWEALMESGKEEGILPCGLGARDTLRLEAAMPLYGHEMDETITPLETGLGFAVKMGKPDFIGRKALEEKGAPAVARVGLRVIGRGIIREHESVWCEGKEVGKTTSGTFAPYLKTPVAMALIDRTCTKTGTRIEVNVRGRNVAAEVVALPFYKRKK